MRAGIDTYRKICAFIPVTVLKEVTRSKVTLTPLFPVMSPASFPLPIAVIFDHRHDWFHWKIVVIVRKYNYRSYDVLTYMHFDFLINRKQSPWK